ncbi:hypothetical protein BRC81_00080 [Halobacteriales archaeon QS_1_68_20]|nr:MAG: hypothetical protein BRC81_00080 [Halobacteriales archaeon QS_1_68_20]
MKWRCEGCGKPHERNDPPCDNCGHHSFEKAVVPLGPDGEGGPLVWVCTECGREHPRNSPPCSRCGNTTLEKREQTVEDPLDGPNTTDDESTRTGDGSATADGAPDGPGGDTTTVWACTECGRAHPRNSPPCSRCGNMDLEREVRKFDDVGGGGGWLDALDRKYALGFVGAFVLLGVVLASTFGLLGLGGPPSVEDVPGSAESVEGLSLSEVEDEFVAELDEYRADAGLDSFDRPESLQQMATYYNQRRVKADYGDGDPPDPRTVYEKFDYRCGGTLALDEYPPPAFDDVSAFDDESQLSTVLAQLESQRLVEDHEEIGVDVHAAPDGTLYVAVFAC